jgi:heme/copper-type cytochrome/quinol oxidase subunit 3
MSDPSQHHRTPRARRQRDTRRHHTPPGTGTFGMWLFLAALTMLFAATLAAYILLRIRAGAGPPLGDLAVPAVFWASTAAILTSSYTMHRALQSVRAERQTRFRNALLLTLLLAAAFLLLQAPGMTELVTTHLGQASTALYGLMFFLVAVHAAHVIGGLIPLMVITVRANMGRYDHESHAPVKYVAMYWHFLDGVWLVMLFVLLVLG